jgi:asparagine synthase (glutamine-hydrolysing)
MCGIAGYVTGAGTESDGLDTILRMVRPLATRGPDDEGIALLNPANGSAAALRTAETAADAPIAPATASREQARLVVPEGVVPDGFRFPHRFALGHRRFSIIDPSAAGHQPFWSSDGDVCVTFNGEIYNYVELRTELERAGARFHTRSDTEVLVEAYRHWGEACFERFVGFWGLALLDRRRGAVLLSRDRLGKAPLYMARVNGTLYWSSEIKSLRAGAGAGTFDVRDQAVSDFVTFGFRDVHNGTFFEQVESFPRASWSWIAPDGSLSPQRYWEMPRRRLSERQIAPAEAAAGLRSALTDSLRLRLRADVPVGVELSGGLDSSALVATAASEGYRLRAFTVSFPGTDVDEQPFAAAVARRWSDRVEYNVLEPKAADFFDNAHDYVAHMDEPFHSPNVFTNHQIWREMAAQGLRVTTNGAAGDELFCGYPGVYLIPYLSAMLERGQLRRLHREATAFTEAPAAPGSRLYWSRLVKAAFHSTKRRSRTAAEYGATRRTEALAATLISDLPRPIREEPAAIEGLVEEKMTDWLMSYWLRAGHQNNMGVPIERRHPFLDHRVVEFALSLPVTYSIRDGWLKWILRRAVEDILPAEVVYRRSKLGFPFPIDAWLAENKARFFQSAGGASTPCPYVDLDRLAAGYDQLIRVEPMMLWRAMSVCLWWKRCVLGEALGDDAPTAAHASSNGTLRRPSPRPAIRR